MNGRDGAARGGLLHGLANAGARMNTDCRFTSTDVRC